MALRRLWRRWQARLLAARIRAGFACPRCGRMAGSEGTVPLQGPQGGWACPCGEFVAMAAKEEQVWELR